MTLIRTTTVVAISLAAIALTGCTAPTVDTPAPTDTTEPPASAAVLPTDEQMCWQYSDAVTLFLNMRLAERDGRLAGGEWDGIQRLTARMIDGIPVDESTEVGAALAELQQSIPDARAGGLGQGPDLTERMAQGTQSDPVQAACTTSFAERGAAWGIEGWVGG